jgi:exopolysaccharide biosynthesis predicted pyruvyltransferase EpsI
MTECQVGFCDLEGRLDIRRYLAQLGPEPVIFRPNRGNAGDALIALATFHLFREQDVPYRLWRHGQDYEGETLVLGGGGGLIPAYKDCAEFLAEHHRKAKRLILLPHTIAGHTELLRQLGSHVEILCRERVSYDYVREVARSAQVYLADDLALSMDPRAILKETPPDVTGVIGEKSFRRGLAQLNRKLVLRAATSRVTSLLTRNPSRVLYCVREDEERTSFEGPRMNIDLSARVSWIPNMLCQRRIRRAGYEFLRFLDAFDEVHTNRIHVCIASALLGKQVRLYANSYWKNRAIFEASLEGRFDNVAWCC